MLTIDKIKKYYGGEITITPEGDGLKCYAVFNGVQEVCRMYSMDTPIEDILIATIQSYNMILIYVHRMTDIKIAELFKLRLLGRSSKGVPSLYIAAPDSYKWPRMIIPVNPTQNIAGSMLNMYLDYVIICGEENTND